jgi:predicted nucleic-acid-binding protein
VALVETTWVLSRTYNRTPRADRRHHEGLLSARELIVEQSETHYLALGTHQTPTADYADAVITQAGKRAGCDETVTFDRRSALGVKMRLLESLS